jgi:ferrous iron transport protein B
MAMELPTYKRPSLRTAFVGTFDRARLFVRNAGTNILVICVVLWWLGAYPRVTPPPEVSTIRNAISGTTVPNADVYIPPGPVADALATKSLSSLRGVVLVSRDTAIAEADRLEARHQKTHSFLGTIGRGIEPVFRPLGFDWQLTIGVLASFAAREVFVSTMNVVIAGQETPQDDAAKANLMLQIQEAKRSDGVTPIFTPAASWSLLVFFVLAMQCLPTLAVTARESGHVKWALLQLVWMTGVAYVAAAIVYQVMR